MAKLTHAESRRLYSWWWDSHISPKNSKWLQENLTEMDFKVKAMIKLIEEDADSFARRAEMYYKKRPELMKLVEEFYRAYRALSERYDHATGALRQARRTIEDAFPNQISFMPSDEPHSDPSSIGSASHAPPGPVFDADDSQKNHDVKKDRTESEKEATLLQHSQSLERISNMEAEISHYQQELKKLNDEMLISVSNLKNAEERYLLLDEANQSLQSELDALKQRANEQSVELKKKQEDLENLKDMELSKMGVEEEIRQLKEENGSLNEQILASALKIISLQDEIILLKDMKAKLEDEVRFHEEEKVVLQQEISYLKEDKIELEKRDYQLMEQIEELKVTCKKHEDEKVFHLENLKLMENISEKNVVLENSLLGANVEIEGSREKINMLQDSCGSLNATISVHLSEKASLVSQVEKLSDRSKFLENSMSDMNAELESLRVKLKNMEESCRSLFAQNYTLLSEKDTLVSQVERAIRSLETLETRYFELEHKHLNLENEKESALDEIMELEDSFKQEKGEYETLIMSIMLSSNSQVSSLENQIGFLHEEAQLGEEEFEAEQHNLMDAQIENFIFQNCLRDTYEICHRQLEAAKCSDKLISELRKELLVQGKKLASSSELNEKLREGIRSILGELCVINKGFNFLNGVEDESILELTLREIKYLSNSISDTQNENQHLLLENSIILTILTQFGLQAKDPRMEKDALERGFENKIQEFSVSQEAHSTLQSDVSKLLEENHSLSKNFYNLKEKSDMLEEENSIFLTELVTVEYLYLIFKNSSEERASELQVSKNYLVHLHGVKNALDQEIGPAIEKLVSTMIENIHLKEMGANLQGSFEILENDLNMTRNICEQSKLEIESTKSLSSQKDIQLLQADQKLRSIKEESMEVRTRLEGLQLDLDKVMKVREELDNKIISLDDGNAMRDHQIMGLRQENEMIIKENDQFRQEIDDLKTREKHLIYDLQKGIDEVNSCEIEVERLLNDFHTTTVNSLIFEEKALELLMACEMCTMIQREKLHEEINLANADMNELKEKLASIEDENGILKEELNAYLLPITTLSDDIASLEEHTFSLANHHKPNYQEKREDQMFYHEHGNSTQKPSDNHNEIISTRGLVELKKLRDRVKALEMVVVSTGNLIQQGMFEPNSDVEVVMKEIEALKSEANSRDSKDIDKAKYEQMMKDIQLDRYGTESNDDTSHELISIMSESSERADIDKLQFPKRFSESHQDWNKSAIQRLLSDAKRLSLLQVSVEELKRDMEASKMNRSPEGSEFDTVTAKLRESEGEVSKLIETNSELIKKSEELLSALPDEMRIVSERTGRLEYDLEKIKYVILKLKEEHENKRGKVFGRRRVLLKDYLYGKMDSRRQKKGRSWRCVRPKTMDD